MPSNAYNFTIVGAVESYAITYDGETFAEGGGLLLLTLESTMFGSCDDAPSTGMVSTNLLLG